MEGGSHLERGSIQREGGLNPGGVSIQMGEEGSPSEGSAYSPSCEQTDASENIIFPCDQ